MNCCRFSRRLGTAFPALVSGLSSSVRLLISISVLAAPRFCNGINASRRMVSSRDCKRIAHLLPRSPGCSLRCGCRCLAAEQVDDPDNITSWFNDSFLGENSWKSLNDDRLVPHSFKSCLWQQHPYLLSSDVVSIEFLHV